MKFSVFSIPIWKQTFYWELCRKLLEPEESECSSWNRSQAGVKIYIYFSVCEMDFWCDWKIRSSMWFWEYVEKNQLLWNSFYFHCLEGKCGVFLNGGLEITPIILHFESHPLKVFFRMCDVSLVNRGVLRKTSYFWSLEMWALGSVLLAIICWVTKLFSKIYAKFFLSSVHFFSLLVLYICTYFDLYNAFIAS